MIYREARGGSRDMRVSVQNYKAWGLGGTRDPPPDSWSLTEDRERREQPGLV